MHTIEQYLHIRGASGGSLSPDGTELAFLSNLSGLPQAWVVAAQSGWPRRITFTDHAVRQVSWSPTGAGILFTMDAAGNERTQLYLVRPDGTDCRPLTANPNAIHHFADWSPDGRRIAYASNERDPQFFDVWLLELETGARTCLLQHDGTNFAGRFSPDGGRLLISRWLGSLDRDVLVLDLASGETRLLTAHDGVVSHDHAVWSPDGRRVLLLTDREAEFVHLVELGLDDGAWKVRRRDDWDLENLAIAADGTLAYTLNRDGHSELWLDPAGGRERVADLPLGVIGGLEFSADSRRLCFGLDGPRHNPDVWIHEVGGGSRQVTFSDRAGIAVETLVEPELIRYPTFDQRDIPAWWYPPTPERDTGAAIVYLHGGPESQTRAQFNPMIQYLVNRGHGVLAPNVRGSTGYGKTWHHLDDVRLRMDSVADAAAAVDWLAEQGGRERAKLACYGGSYGGFMVLALVTHYPRLWAAGVDIVGIANFVTFLEQTGAYRRRLRESEYGSLAADGDFLREISPVNHVDRVVAPMFIVQGANDPRVPKLESDQMVERLRAREIPVEYLVFDDEGHGLVKLENRITAYRAIAEFLDRWVAS